MTGFPFPLVQWDPDCVCFHGPERHRARIVDGLTVTGCVLCGCPGMLHDLQGRELPEVTG